MNIMKTLTLHINDNIFEDVKKFLALFSPEKIKIESHQQLDTLLDSSYLDRKELKKMKIFFSKFNIPFPENLNKAPFVYNEDDLDNDMKNLKELNLLK
ncbi:MAG: hypothetical protein DRJ05_13590 [Bacteroidetes bacterium]|nr:MAG: hypothetical protein DRJ05_13590 [Bacteroidota bacterium]